MNTFLALWCWGINKYCLPDIARLITITTPAVRHTLLSSTLPYLTLTLRRHITDITANPHCVPISLRSRWLAECTRLSKRHRLSQVSNSYRQLPVMWDWAEKLQFNVDITSHCYFDRSIYLLHRTVMIRTTVCTEWLWTRRMTLSNGYTIRATSTVNCPA